jgi:hypothetical protein
VAQKDRLCLPEIFTTAEHAVKNRKLFVFYQWQQHIQLFFNRQSTRFNRLVGTMEV